MPWRPFSVSRPLVMNHIILSFLFLILTVSEERPLWAAPIETPPSIEISAAVAAVALGDSVSIRCTVHASPDVEVGEPFLREDNPFIEIERRVGAEERSGGGTVRRYEYLAYIFSPDSVRIGPFFAEYVTARGDSGEIVSNALEFAVAGFVQSDEDPPEPSRAPIVIAGGRTWAWFLVMAAGLLAFVAAAFLLLRKRKRPAAMTTMEPSLNEIEEFENIRALHLRESGQVKELYIRISDAMRGFIHRNMGFEARYSTTGEIRRKLDLVWGDRDTAEAVGAILEESDMVKFARHIPPDDLINTLIDRSIDPVRKVLERIEAERERIAKEEIERAAVSSVSGEPGGRGGKEEERE